MGLIGPVDHRYRRILCAQQAHNFERKYLSKEPIAAGTTHDLPLPITDKLKHIFFTRLATRRTLYPHDEIPDTSPLSPHTPLQILFPRNKTLDTSPHSPLALRQTRHLHPKPRTPHTYTSRFLCPSPIQVPRSSRNHKRNGESGQAPLSSLATIMLSASSGHQCSAEIGFAP